MKNSHRRFLSRLAGFAAIALVAFGAPAFADSVGMPRPWELGFQDPATPVAEWQHKFHQELLYIITGISIFVLLLLITVVVRFNAKANPVPSTRTHNVPLEIVWTVLPILLLIVIAIPSMKLLYYGDRTAKPDMTVKVIGHQWNWSYEYPAFDGLGFTSIYLKDNEIDQNKHQVYLLSVDKPLVLPVDSNIQILTTATDVIHSFAVPSFGIKTDAVPGRLNETWIRITRPGTYYGQCSELCGQDHGFMPIEVRAVPKDEFTAWANAAKTDYISYDQFEASRAHSPATTSPAEGQ